MTAYLSLFVGGGDETQIPWVGRRWWELCGLKIETLAALITWLGFRAFDLLGPLRCASSRLNWPTKSDERLVVGNRHYTSLVKG